MRSTKCTHPPSDGASRQRQKFEDALLGHIERLRKSCKEEQARAAALAEELEALRATRSVRMARAVSEAIGSPRSLLRLPARLLEIAREQAESPAPDARAADPGQAAPSTFHAACLPGRTLRVAAIVDPFTELGLRGDCELMLVAPGVSGACIDAFSPDLLFVESAWTGNAGAWQGAIAPPSGYLLELLLTCRRLGVPTVFWNKEDPSHFEHFLDTAQLFDHVLTTDADCIERYAREAGCADVDVMLFACQPRLHNPLDTGARTSAAVFAGSYYRKYPDRMQSLDRIQEALPTGLAMEIFDRNLGTDDDAFQFPATYVAAIRGGVPPEEMPHVYRRYAWAINLNTITTSPTMMSRRVFELLACNCLVLSNRSQAMEKMFGDAVIVEPSREFLAAVLADPRDQARRRLAGLRAVMTHHTWRDRIAQLVALVGVEVDASGLPHVRVLAAVDSLEDAERIVTEFKVQEGVCARLDLLVPDRLRALIPVEHRVRCLSLDNVRGEAFADGEAFCYWSSEDAHGPRHLLDLVLATRYSDARLVGKAVQLEDCYRTCDRLPWRGAMALPGGGWHMTLDELARQGEHGEVRGARLVALDAFNFRRDARGQLPADARDTPP